MKTYQKYFLFFGMAVLMANCQKKEIAPIDNVALVRQQIIGDWITEAYKFESEDTLTKSSEPYIILNEYGSGFTLEEDQSYYTFYSEKEGKGFFRGSWELLNENTIQFTKDTMNQQPLKIFTVAIQNLEKDKLSIKENEVEYHLVPF